MTSCFKLMKKSKKSKTSSKGYRQISILWLSFSIELNAKLNLTSNKSCKSIITSKRNTKKEEITSMISMRLIIQMISIDLLLMIYKVMMRWSI
jgi:hypothetical protein